jgi:hypothetical protein
LDVGGLPSGSMYIGVGIQFRLAFE